MNFQNVCIIGGGSLGHVITGWLAAGGHNVSILTRRPQAWSQNFLLHTPDGDRHCPIARISSDPAEVIPSADVILLTVPGYANASELQAIKPHLKRVPLWGACSAHPASSSKPIRFSTIRCRSGASSACPSSPA